MQIINLQSSCFISNGERKIITSKYDNYSIRDYIVISYGDEGLQNRKNSGSEVFSVALFRRDKT